MSLSARQLTPHLPDIRGRIKKWEQNYSPDLCTDTDTDTGLSKDVIVAFRTRLEWLAREYATDDTTLDENFVCRAVTVGHTDPGSTILHVPTMKWNGLALTQKTFTSDLAFGPEATNADVYAMTVQTYDVCLMIPLVLSGGIACILAYGQTGTGKTFSITSIEKAISTELFKAAAIAGSQAKMRAGVKYDADVSIVQAPTTNGDGNDAFEISVSFMEMIGKSAYDLTVIESTDEERKPINISEDKMGKVRPDLIQQRVKSASELEDIIEKCLSYRRTSGTQRNEMSSRSHAILTIRIKNLLLPGLDNGEFILVDLAGSERYEDRKAHSRQLMDESKENNKSLLALKECVRARARAGAEDGFVHIPYRSNRLTLVLKPIFDLEETRKSKTLVIAHISPHVQDISHSANTLSYAAPFKVVLPKRSPSAFDAHDPRTWDHAESIKWLQDAFLEERQARRIEEWRHQEEQANLRKQRLRPLTSGDNDAPLLVKLEAFCPEPYGGRFLANMHGAQWVENCLKHLNTSADLRDDDIIPTVKEDSLNVYWAFHRILISARTRTRNAIMNTRRAVSVPDECT
ncbi:P-loop containing nucleoside triphosphate hydrolase protein [Cyathus striatus]|nr:P-loop containing nucleoside triphosphate hydrolase protein [Cyathus striatus]